jgi:hypothetical protein
MSSTSSSVKRNIIIHLAEAISSFSLIEVADLLEESGAFAIQNKEKKIVLVNKPDFLEWLGNCFHDRSKSKKSGLKLDHTIIHCLHCITGNPILIFDNGKFPYISTSKDKKEKSGLLIRFTNDKITGIEICFLILKSENPFIYEKKVSGSTTIKCVPER